MWGRKEEPWNFYLVIKQRRLLKCNGSAKNNPTIMWAWDPEEKDGWSPE